MKLIVGLGNPGTQYAGTRHNFGFMIVDQLAAALGAGWRPETKFEALVAAAQTEQLVLAKPQTFMNNSGSAVQKLMQFYKIDPTGVWVIADDLDTSFGRLKVRLGGSAGGHQGLHSIIEHIGPNFIRARAGISLNNRALEPSESYVLRNFEPAEREQLPVLIKRAANAILRQLAQPEPAESTFDLLSS